MECDNVMRTEVIDGITVLYADEGKTLTNGEVYSTEVWLGNDTWWECDVPEEELMPDTPIF